MEPYGVTTDDQLRALAKKMGFKINFIGFAEELPQRPPEGVNIINLGDDKIGGTHWTLMFVDNTDRHIYYFDSYGAPPEDPINEMAKRYEYKLTWTKKQVQGYSESYCGIWALMMAKTLLTNLNREKAIDDFLNRYDPV